MDNTNRQRVIDRARAVAASWCAWMQSEGSETDNLWDSVQDDMDRMVAALDEMDREGNQT